MHSDVNTVLGPPIATSTPVANVHSNPTRVVTHDELSGIMSDFAKQIGESITSSLNAMQSSRTQLPAAGGVSSSPLESSQLKVVVQSEAKAPPFFRGDLSDTFSIQEWEGMMKCYLSRANCETPEGKYELIMSRLTGKARDVVKVSLRCRPDLSGGELLTAVFDVLKHHFSELTCSTMPMRDFYNTMPRAGEDAMDYWIRLNKSIDVVDECLRRRGKSVEDPSAEVVMMFVSHCPDPALSLCFGMKAPEEWTAAEVQRRLDCRVRQVRGVAANPHMVASALPSQPSITADSAEWAPSCPKTLPPDNVHGSPQLLFGVGTKPHPSAVAMPQPIVSPPYGASSVPTSDPVTQQMVAMFDKVLSLCTASVANNEQRGGRGRGFQRPQQRPQQRACEVCGSSEHTTHSHCRLFRLCLSCFGPGHMRSECTRKDRPIPTTAPSNVNLN